jgi:hypothetical protein
VLLDLSEAFGKEFNLGNPNNKSVATVSIYFSEISGKISQICNLKTGLGWFNYRIGLSNQVGKAAGARWKAMTDEVSHNNSSH